MLLRIGKYPLSGKIKSPFFILSRVELSIDFVKCSPPVKKTQKSLLSLTVAKASYTLVNFLIYDTEEMS